MADSLTPKQMRFVEEYLVDLNGTQAAIRAGYSPRTARVQAAALLTKPDICDELARRQQKRGSKLDISIDRIERELARIAFADMRRYARWGPTTQANHSEQEADGKVQDAIADEHGIPFAVPPMGVMLLSSEDLTDDETAAVKEVTETAIPGGGLKYGIKLHDKMKALELLGKRHGMWVDRHEHTGKDGKPIQTEVKSGLSEATAEFIRKQVLGVKG